MKGHIRERSPGHWAIVIDAQDGAGKRKRRWYSCKGTKREAQIQCAKLIAELQSGTSIDPNKITVMEFLDRFDRDWIATHVGARSGERYRFSLDHVRRHLGEKLLQKVRPADLAAFYAALARTGLAPRTIKLVHSALHRALGQVGGYPRQSDRACQAAEGLGSGNANVQPDLAAALLDNLMLASLALGTGMRRNEMLGLRWQDIDLAAGRLTIEQSLEQ